MTWLAECCVSSGKLWFLLDFMDGNMGTIVGLRDMVGCKQRLSTTINPNMLLKYHFLLTLTHWGRVTHICFGKLTIIGSDNGLSPERRQAIIWTNAGILLIRSLRTNFSEILIEIQTFSLKKIGLKMSSAKWRPFCLGLNVLTERLYLFSIRLSLPPCVDWRIFPHFGVIV